MDTMTIESAFTRGLISSFLTKTIRKKTGVDAQLSLRNLHVSISDEAKVSIELDASMKKEELAKLMKLIG